MSKLPNLRDTYSGTMGDSNLRRRPNANDLDEYMQALNNPKPPVFETVERISNCQAWVVRDTANNMICLQSYYTIVSIKVGNGSKDLANYSSTTSRHQCYFRRWCSECEG